MASSRLNDLLREQIKRSIDDSAENAEYIQFVLQRKAQRRRIIAIALLLCAPIFAYFISRLTGESFFDSTKSTIILVSGFVVAVGAAALSYLQPSVASKDYVGSPSDIRELKYYIDKRLSDLKYSQSNTPTPIEQFSDADKLKIFESIQAKLESEALQSYLAGIKDLVATNIKESSLESHFKNITARLSREVENLAKRGNLNLILGILTTLIGLIVLGYSVFYSPESHTPEELLAYFLPRISLVVLIEVFAYFFLRLYKQSLSEIKYFQNEITNIEAKQLAVSIIANHNDASLITRVVESLSNTERNFTINKDQTTIDLERERLASQNHTNLLTTIKDLINRKDG